MKKWLLCLAVALVAVSVLLAEPLRVIGPPAVMFLNKGKLLCTFAVPYLGTPVPGDTLQITATAYDAAGNSVIFRQMKAVMVCDTFMTSRSGDRVYYITVQEVRNGELNLQSQERR